MRYLKKLLLSIYIYIGIFGAACLIAWIVRGDEPAALIAGVFSAAGAESVIAGIMKLNEIAAEKAEKRKDNHNE